MRDPIIVLTVLLLLVTPFLFFQHDMSAEPATIKPKSEVNIDSDVVKPSAEYSAKTETAAQQEFQALAEDELYSDNITQSVPVNSKPSKVKDLYYFELESTGFNFENLKKVEDSVYTEAFESIGEQLKIQYLGAECTESVCKILLSKEKQGSIVKYQLLRNLAAIFNSSENKDITVRENEYQIEIYSAVCCNN